MERPRHDKFPHPAPNLWRLALPGRAWTGTWTKRDRTGDMSHPSLRKLKPLFWLSALICVFILSLVWLNLWVALGGLLFGTLWTMGEKRLPVIVALCLAIPLIGFVLVEQVLQMTVPLLMAEGILTGIGTALTLQNVLWVAFGCLAGTLIGMMPGLGPITNCPDDPRLLFLDPTGGLIMMAGVYYGAGFRWLDLLDFDHAPGWRALSPPALTAIQWHGMVRPVEPWR